MEFSNTQLSTQNLPAIEGVDFRPLEKTYLAVSRLTFIIFFLVTLLIGVAAFSFFEQLRTPLLMYSLAAGFIVLSVILWMAISISFTYSGYALREKDILFRRGWLIRKTSAIPLKRVQHVSVQSGPLERRYGLASISIYTAGSDEADLSIRGITTETAQQIKEWISNQLNGAIN